MNMANLDVLAGTFAAVLLGFSSSSVGGQLAHEAEGLMAAATFSSPAGETSGPVLKSVSPPSVASYPPGCRRPFLLSGDGLLPGDQIVVTWSGGETVLDPLRNSGQVEYRGETKIVINISTDIDPDRWKLMIKRAPDVISNAVTFDVKAANAGTLASIIGEFNGVEARSNGICTAESQDQGANKCSTNWNCEAHYQCVEYVKRYYDQHFHGIEEAWNSTWYDANTFFNRGVYKALERVKYQTAGAAGCQLPEPGDMIFFKTNHPDGHVAIVTEVGDGGVSVIQQNMDRYTAAAVINITRDSESGSCQIGPTMTIQQRDGTSTKKSFPVRGWIKPKQKLRGVDFRNFKYDLGNTACGNAIQKITGQRSVILNNGRYLAPRSGLLPDFHVALSEDVAAFHDVDSDGEAEAVVLLFCGHALRNWALPILYRWKAGVPSIVAYLAESHRALGGPTTAIVEMSSKDLEISYSWRKRLLSEAYEETSVYRWVDGTLKRIH